MTFSIIQKSQLEGALRLDAEYYQPEYLELLNNVFQTTSYKFWKDIEGKFITGPFGSEFNVENYILDGKYRYVRGKDVKEFFITENDNVYIPEADFERLKKYALQRGDILISVVGTLGNTAIVDKDVLPAIFSCKSTVFRTDAVDNHYLLAYLNSKYGQQLLERSVRGAVQTGLNIDDLRDLPIFIPSQENQEKAGQIVRNAKKEFENSKSLYHQSENLLLEELGLQNFDEETALSTIVNFSDVLEACRMDAEYFQEKYGELISKIKNQKSKSLKDCIENIPAKFDPTAKPEESFKYVELSNINSSIGTIDGHADISGREAPGRAKRILKAGDVIVSSVEGSLGKVALVEKEQGGYLASTGFFQFRSEEILPEALLIMAKSIVFKMQLEKQCAGTILTAVPKEAIKNVVIPILPIATQQKIAELVRESHEARKKAKELLEEAKGKVEEMIEKKS